MKKFYERLQIPPQKMIFSQVFLKYRALYKYFHMCHIKIISLALLEILPILQLLTLFLIGGRYCIGLGLGFGERRFLFFLC